MAEIRAFKIHPRLLVDVIKRQSGNLTKALQEIISNSIDAGSSEIRVTITPEKVTVIDDGKGFSSREEVESFFEVFGLPHDDSENKTFGRFRMGRGQAFSFGKNIWRTNSFEMTVDVEHMMADASNPYGVSYELKDNLPLKAGCHIEIFLYDKLEEWQMRNAISQIGTEVKYCACRIIVNDQLVSNNPKTEKWTMETDDFHLKITGGNSGIRIYNLGIYTMSVHDYGLDGVCVSKKRLDVNFARNNIINTCSVWKSMKAAFKKVGENIFNKKRLNDSERRRIISGFCSGEFNQTEIWQSPIFPDVTGKYWSLKGLDKKGTFWSFDEEGSVKGDRIIQMGLAIVLDKSILAQFDYHGTPEFFFTDKLSASHLTSTAFRTVDALIGNVDMRSSIVEEKSLTPREKTLLKSMRFGASEIERDFNRQLLIGISSVMDGWTDGDTFIAINREFIRRMDGSLQSFCRLAHLLLHEITHEDISSNSHIHSPQFYQDFHDNIDRSLRSARTMYENYAFNLKRLSKKIESEKEKEAKIAEVEKMLKIENIAKSTDENVATSSQKFCDISCAAQISFL